MNILFILFIGFTIGISGAMIPGPFTLFTVSEVLKANKVAGFKTILGHIIFEFAAIIAIFLGFHKMFIRKEFLSAMSIIGGLAFMVMGIILILSAGKMQISNIKPGSGLNKHSAVIGGIFFSVVSPGFLVWWATIGFSTLVKASLLAGVTGVIVLIVGHWLADAAWYGFLSYAIDKGKKYLNDRLYQNAIRVVSIILIILGFNFLIIKT